MPGDVQNLEDVAILVKRGLSDDVELTDVEYIDFELNPTSTLQEGRMQWNPNDKTVDIGLPGGSTLQTGQELLTPRAKNNQGSEILNGQAVYVSGASGDNPEMKLANASNQTGSKVLAIATQTIPDGQFGFYTTFGLVRDINTSTCTVGEEIFLDETDGGLTPDKLYHPNFRVRLGYCMRKHATEGVIYVTIKGDQWLKRMQSAGEPTGFDFNQSDLRGDISKDDTTDPANPVFTIEPKAGQDYFNFWIRGQEFRKETSESIITSLVEGLHVIYYDENGDLQEAVNPTDAQVDIVIRMYAIVTILYWDAINEEYSRFGEERHLNQDGGGHHSYHHFINGLRYINGLGLNTLDVDQSGALNSHAQFGVDAGSVADEDLFDAISAVTSTTGLPVFYFSGANADLRREFNSGFSVLTYDGTDATRLAWNEFTGGAWQKTEVTNNDFVNCHIFATTDIEYPMIAVMGQDDYLNRPAAREGADIEILTLVTGGLNLPEIRPIATVIFQTGNYANDVNAKTVSVDTDGNTYVDWRNENISRSVVSTSDHNSLSNLQGGTTNEYYHLTSADYIAAQTVNDSGTTIGRPTASFVGQPYFDTDLGIPIWWDGSNWIDATGATV